MTLHHRFVQIPVSSLRRLRSKLGLGMTLFMDCFATLAMTRAVSAMTEQALALPRNGN